MPELYPADDLYPSDSLYPGEGLEEGEGPGAGSSRIAVIHEYDPDELAVRIEPPDGAPTRLAADEWRPENVLDNLECFDEIPGGDKESRLTLARDPRAPQPDLAPFSRGTVYGPGGEVVWGPGRLGKTSHIEGDSKSISVELEGNSTKLEDNKALKLGLIDSSMSRWGEPSTERRIDMQEIGREWVNASFTQSAAGDSAIPALIIAMQQWQEGKSPTAEMWYHGGGVDLGALLYDFFVITAAGTESIANQAYLSGDDRHKVAGGSGTNHKNTAANQQYVAATGDGIRYALLHFIWTHGGSGTNGGDSWGWRNLRVLSRLATQNLTLQGTWPEVGYTARQILEYVITNLTGLEFDAESEDDGYIIPHAWWSDYTTLAAVVQELTRYGLLDWMVFGDKFSLRKPGTYGERWKLYSGSSEFQEDGEDTSRSWRKITVVWPDPDGTTRSVGPIGSGADYETAELEITDPDHPAVKADEDRHDVLVLKTGYKDLAIGTGGRWLVEANELSHAGSCAVSGWAQNDKGIWKPASQFRAGDLVSRADSGDPSYRKVTSRAYTHPERKAQLSLDAPPGGLQALLERYDADLISLGAS